MALKIKFKKSKTSDTSNSVNKSEMSSYIEHTATTTDYKVYIEGEYNPDAKTQENPHMTVTEP